MKTKFAAVVLAASLSTQAVAQVPCLTEPEFQSVARFVTPDLLDGIVGGCAKVLPADSYLRRSGPQVVARYRTAAAGTWPEVKALVARMPDLKMFAVLDEASMRALMGGLFKEGIAKEKLKVGDCTVASDALAALDPLPPANMFALMTALAHLDRGQPAKGDKKARQPLLCPTAVAAR